MNTAQIKSHLHNFPLQLTVLSTLGLLASLKLSIEKVHLLENPDATLSCSINPVYSCQNVINSDQASVLGFPNEFIGIAFFAGMLALGLALSSGAKLGKWLHQLAWFGLVGSMAFVFWFFYQSVYSINALCIYCSTIWLTTWTLFVIYTRWLIKSKTIKAPKKYTHSVNTLVKNTLLLWFLLIAIFAGLILNHFWYYYGQYF